jgi:hypothetical protein
MNNSNLFKSLLSDNTKLPTISTATIKLAANSIVNKSYFAKIMAETSQYNWHIDSGAIYIIIPNKAWFVTYEPKENKHIKIGNKKLQKIKKIGTVKLPNGLRIQNVRHIPSIKVNFITLADLRHYKPRYLWETAEFLLHIDDTTTIRVPMSDRLWPMHFKVMPTPKPRTPKQNAQEAQTLTEAPATEITTAVTTAITTAAITVITTAATTATTTAAITATTITVTTATKATIKKAKGKAKRRALPLERWHKRLGHLNYADVK